MFDVLVYLFENYSEGVELRYPDQHVLARKLSAAGFEDDEISRALVWLKGLQDLSESASPLLPAQGAATRVYAAQEMRVLDAACRGFLAFLEHEGMLNPVQREAVVDRVLALEDEELNLEKVKWIVLMVLGSQGQELDYLFVEELLGNGLPLQVH
jgi:Smg protein